MLSGVILTLSCISIKLKGNVFFFLIYYYYYKPLIMTYEYKAKKNIILLNVQGSLEEGL